MKSQIKLELRPNNQITLTHGAWRKPAQEAYKSAYLTDKENREQKKFGKKLAIAKSAAIAEREKNEYRKAIGINPSQSQLDIILKSQRTERSLASRLNTPKNFTHASGQHLRECGAAMDIACRGDTRFCHEITLTLPANTQEAFHAIAAKSGYIVNRLFQPIRRRYGIDCLWFFVWEYQQRGALHFHGCIYHPDECEGLFIAAQIIEQWHQILIDVSIQCDTDMFARKNGRSCTIRSLHQHHTAPIRKAVGAYFSKYAGKQESKQSWYCKKYPVSRFWGSSAQVKKIVSVHSARFDLDLFNEQEANKKLEQIIENILEKLSIISSTSYDFDVNIGYGASRRNVAVGTRHTFYFDSIQFEQAMGLVCAEMSVW
jgi:hypothetical protein